MGLGGLHPCELFCPFALEVLDLTYLKDFVKIHCLDSAVGVQPLKGFGDVVNDRLFLQIRTKVVPNPVAHYLMPQILYSLIYEE